MATEERDAVYNAQRRHIRTTEGASIDPYGLAMVRPSKELEDAIMSMPTNEQETTGPAQHPETGVPYFMLDMDGLDEAPLA